MKRSKEILLGASNDKNKVRTHLTENIEMNKIKTKKEILQELQELQDELCVKLLDWNQIDTYISFNLIPDLSDKQFKKYTDHINNLQFLINEINDTRTRTLTLKWTLQGKG